MKKLQEQIWVQSIVCVATFKNRDLVIIPNARKNETTPSYVSFTENGLLFGEDAKENAYLNPNNTVCF